MELGPQLKQARLEAGLSQRQLCGDVITRNMLSQIENGSAQPSMDTLRCLAARLGKPVSFFLEEETVSPNQARIRTAREAFAQGHWQEALTLLEQWQEPDAVFDPERYLLEALCCLRLGQGAEALLTRAAASGAQTPYYTPELERHRLLLLAEVCPDRQSEVAAALPDDPRELLLRGAAALEAGHYALARKWLELAQEIAPEAAWPLLETCCRYQEDYKAAYHYACLQRNLAHESP